jgi:hypothetical protein
MVRGVPDLGVDGGEHWQMSEEWHRASIVQPEVLA